MLTSNDFSALIVTRANNPKRLEAVINRIKKYYPDLEIVIVFDSVSSCFDASGYKNIKTIETLNRVYVSGGYNLALKHSTKPYFVFLHDDTFICKNFIEGIIPHIDENTFGNFITVEPSKYNNKDSELKPIRDFGIDIDDFNEKAFDDFCSERLLSLSQKCIPNPYGGFFMSGSRKSIMKLGGFDEIFRPFFHEDGDLMMRLILAGYKFTTCLESCVYHMVSLTARSDQTEEILSSQQTNKIFIEKWGTSFDNFKVNTIDKKIPYQKINIKLQKINFDKTNPYHKFITSFFKYDKTKPYSIAIIDFNKLNKKDIEVLHILPYIIISNMDKDRITVGNFLIFINKKSQTPINLVVNI